MSGRGGGRGGRRWQLGALHDLLLLSPEGGREGVRREREREGGMRGGGRKEGGK